MSIESVRAFFAEKAPDITVIESPMSSATVTLAAEAYGVEPARIAKTLSLRIGDRVGLIVAAGTSRMDNKKLKAQFGGKPKMLDLEEVAGITGHEVGGVCPFGAEDAVAGLLRCLAEGVRRGGAGRRLHPQRGSHRAGTDGRTYKRRMGRRLPDAGKYRTGLSAVIVMFWRRGRRLRRNRAGTRRGLRLRRRAVVRFEYRAAGSGKLWRILPQARHDPVGVGNLIAAKPPNIGCAGQLLFERAPILFGGRCLNGDTVASRQRKAKDNSLCPHL